MTDERLYRLFKLHEIDEKLHSIKTRAENLDLGKRETAAIKKIQTDYAGDLKAHDDLKKQLAAEKHKSEHSAELIAKYNKQLYDGSIVSSREVENLQKEIKMHEEIGMQAEMNVEDLEKQVATSAKRVEKITSKIAELEAAATQKKQQAQDDHAALKVGFKEVGGQRAGREADVEPELLKVYDAARKRTGTTGLALVTADSRCSGCGVPVPERTRDSIRIGKTQQCESCRRVLFIREEAPE